MFTCDNGHDAGFEPRGIDTIFESQLPGWRCSECGRVIDTITTKNIRWYLDSSFIRDWLSHKNPLVNTHIMYVPSCVRHRTPKMVASEVQ